jgi:hypothetical protein
LSAPAGAAPERGNLHGRAAPPAARTFRGARLTQVAARTVHVVAMALVLGGVAYSAPERAMASAIVLTLASGLLLLGMDLWKGGAFLTQGHGVAVLIKLALLGTGLLLVPAARFECYLAATAVASIGSHMPKTWRHWSFLHRRVID